MKMNVYFISTLLFLPVLIQGTSPLDKSPPRIPPPPNCVDKVLNCQDFLAFCERNDINRFMKENCQKSCGRCEIDCSGIEEGFEFDGKCYKIMEKSRSTWYDAKDMCSAVGMRLVTKPEDPIGLRKYIVDNIANDITHHVWLNAKGDTSGVQYRWQQDFSSLKFRDPLFHSSEPSPGQEQGINGCLCIFATAYDMDLEPNSPYGGCTCYGPLAYPLCEYNK